MNLNSLQNDRAAGVLVTLAAGDALGAGYEFGPALPDTADVSMKGGGPFGFAPSEWTDDTSMAIVIADALLEAAGERRGLDEQAKSAMAQAWSEWAREAKDVGVQTSSVLGRARSAAAAEGRTAITAADAYAASEQVHRSSGRSGGNGSLMRTAPLALAFLDRPERELFDAAMEVSALTHFDPEAGEACALWCLAIRHAVLTGDLDIRKGLELLPGERAALWLERIETAERSRPRDFTRNGWVVEAFQAAWSAITTTTDAASGPAHLRAALEAAVRGGNDTDTVAAIAGGLLGAAHGFTAVPFEWRRKLHGWPGYEARDLQRLALQLARGEGRTEGRWPDLPVFDNSAFISAAKTAVVAHPLDDGVLLGGAPALSRTDYDAVVSLSRVGTAETHVDPSDHASLWVLDEAAADANAHLEFALREAAAAVALFRSEGKRVLLHCVRMESRTPTVAALYGALVTGMTPEQALEKVREVLPHANPNPGFRRLLRRLSQEAQ
ncbi:ADP-ribosylglycohydrolase family protein [Arthrobacter crystallopoietes]|uniref:ADP-ribosylglycohydrolase family protein n=1 Tax=Crystallibacter crystallopoietes TaxID=37928 RepID=UPI001ABEB8EF|nr:ADP-ribosylglycohydrolase family protein [Arthrobacter crystallopoietes]QTG82580.1 ADP-ribosylglycohydrolase family protein [Arthrobacter crystallopoietes]